MVDRIEWSVAAAVKHAMNGRMDTMDKATKTDIIKKYARKEGDTGSPEVQIALLSARINELTEHLKVNFKDHSTRRGLLEMVSLRKKLLSCLARENHARSFELTDELGIRRAK